MKCRICGSEIPEGSRCCPHCGRVITKSDRQRQGSVKPDQTKSDVYKPASTDRDQNEKTIHIPDLFSKDPNAPQYSDPHSYDKATADILKYDRQFIKGIEEPDPYIPPEEPRRQSRSDSNKTQRRRSEQSTYYDYESSNDDYDDNQDDYYDEESGSASGNVSYRDGGERARGKKGINIFLIILAIIVAVSFICVAGYQIFERIGIIDGKEDVTNEGVEDPTNERPNAPTTAPPAAAYQTGKYTVTGQNNSIFMYKSVSDPKIIASIPNDTVITVTEIAGDLGKATYGDYTGYVKLKELKYTPDVKGEDETGLDGEKLDGETTTGDKDYSAGSYKVTLGSAGPTLNIRDKGSMFGNILGIIADGEQVNVDKVENGWGHIKYNGIDGWVSMNYLSPVE